MRLKVQDHPDYVKDSHSILNVNNESLEIYKKLKKINSNKDQRIENLENQIVILNNKFDKLSDIISNIKINIK